MSFSSGSRYIKLLSVLADKHLNIQLVKSSLEEFSIEELLSGEVDTVICINVLEHLEDDMIALRKMLRFLRPEGRLILYVPACRWAFGTMDAAMGHHRRYSHRAIHKLARKAGGSVCASRLVNFIGLMGWWWVGHILKETHIDVWKARFMDRLVAFLSAVERLVKPPIGQSFFAVLQQDHTCSSCLDQEDSRLI